MNGRKNKWMDGKINGKINDGWKNKWMDGKINGWKDRYKFMTFAHNFILF